MSLKRGSEKLEGHAFRIIGKYNAKQVKNGGVVGGESESGDRRGRGERKDACN